MTAVIPVMTPLPRPVGDVPVDEAELAAAAFLARYQGRTIDAYRYDLRASFKWAADAPLEVLKATRPEIELYVRAMEGRGLARTTTDRRLWTVCGFYRFAHIDGRIAANPAQYVRRPKVHPGDARGLDRSELWRLPLRRRALRRRAFRSGGASRAQPPPRERGVFDRHREPRLRARTPGASSGRATSRPSWHSCPERHARSIWPWASGRGSDFFAAATVTAWTDGRLTAGCRSIAKRAGLGIVVRTCSAAAFIMCALDPGVPHACRGSVGGDPRQWSSLREVQIAARHADPRTAYVVVAFVAGG